MTFSAALYATPVLPVPRGDSDVEGLEIESIEPMTAPSPGYAVTVRVRPSVTPAQARQWLDEALPACEDWLGRLRAIFPQP